MSLNSSFDVTQGQSVQGDVTVPVWPPLHCAQQSAVTNKPFQAQLGKCQLLTRSPARTKFPTSLAEAGSP